MKVRGKCMKNKKGKILGQFPPCFFSLTAMRQGGNKKKIMIFESLYHVAIMSYVDDMEITKGDRTTSYENMSEI